MSTMMLNVQCADTQIAVPIRERITIIRGDSGTFKSMLVSHMFSEEDTTTNVSFAMEYALLPLRALDAARGLTNVLLVVDDMLYSNSSRVRKRLQSFIRDCAVVNNLYFLIIERATTELFELSYNIRSILEMRKVSDTVVVALPMYEYLNDRGNASEIITEDTTDGYWFASRIFNTVSVDKSTNGKSDFIKNNFGVPGFTAFLDTSAFGCHVFEFADRHKIDGRHLFYDVLSYEELLWNLYGNSDCYDNTVLSREKFYEDKLSELPDTFKLKSIHGSKHSDCLKNNCNNCTLNCEKEFSGSNIIRRLKELGLNSLTKYYKEI